MNLAEKLGAAVRIPTVSYTDHGRIDLSLHRRFQTLLEELFPAVHRRLRREVFSEYSVLYHWEGTGKDLRPALLLAHYDVVPAADEAEWTRSPFGGEIAGGFVWGRGTLDDKGCLISVLQAAEELIGEGYSPDRPICFAFGGDEESSGREGALKTARILEERGTRFAFTLDEGAAVAEEVVPGAPGALALIGLAEKGFANVELRLKGRAGHAAMPPNRTVAGRIAKAAARIEDSPFPPRLIPSVEGFLAALAPGASGLRRWALAHPSMAWPLLLRILLAKPATAALLRTSQAVTVLEGSPKENVLPDRARAVVNLRVLPGDDTKAALARYRRIANDPEIEIALQPGNGDGEAVPESGMDSPGFRILAASIAEAFPDVPTAPYLTTGCTDSRHYRNIAGDIYRFLPVRLSSEDLGRIHGKDERISLENLEIGKKFYKTFMVKAGGNPGKEETFIPRLS